MIIYFNKWDERMRGGYAKQWEGALFIMGENVKFSKMLFCSQKQVQISSYIIHLCIVCPSRWSIKKKSTFLQKNPKKGIFWFFHSQWGSIINEKIWKCIFLGIFYKNFEFFLIDLLEGYTMHGWMIHELILTCFCQQKRIFKNFTFSPIIKMAFSHCFAYTPRIISFY